MPPAAPKNNENRSATVHRCNAKALYSDLFSWYSFNIHDKCWELKIFLRNDNLLNFCNHVC
jgi:hypothetical protein